MKEQPEITSGETVLLIDKRGRKWLVIAQKGRKFSLDVGEIDLEDLIGKTPGSSITTHLGKKLWILRPTLEDLIMKYRRPTQIIYPKDLGYLLIKSGIGRGSIVVEAGTGSGVLTTVLAWIVHPEGHVYSYEVREEFIEIAKRNLERSNLLEYVTIKQADVTQGIEEKNVDAVFLDFGEPWKAIDTAYDALKGGGVIAVITPTYNQAEKVVEAMGDRFIDIETVEIFLRKILVRKGKTRPNTRMIGYTALLTTGRKVLL